MVSKQVKLAKKPERRPQTRKQEVPKTKQKKIPVKMTVKKRQTKKVIPKGKQKKITDVKYSSLSQITMKEANDLLRKRYRNTHPDTVRTSNITFIRPNRLWKRYPSSYDVLGFDTKKPPLVKKLPEKGLKGQVVELRGKLYVYDNKDKKFKLHKK